MMRAIVVLLLATTATTTKLAEAKDVAKILKEASKVRAQEVMPLREQSMKATLSHNQLISDQHQIITGLKSANADSAQRWETEIERLKRRLAVLEKLQQVATASDPEKAKQQTIQAAKAEIAKRQALRLDADKPTQEKFRQLFRKYQDRHTELAVAVTPYFEPQGKGELESLLRKSVNGQFHDCSFYALYYQDKKPSCQIGVRFRPEQIVRSAVAEQEQLGEGIELIRLTDSAAMLQVGDFHVTVYVQQPNQWNKAKIKKAVTELVDLAGLAKIRMSDK